MPTKTISIPVTAKKTPARDTPTHIPLPPPDLNIDGGFGDRPSGAKTGVFFAASGALRGVAILKAGVRGGRAMIRSF